MLELLITLYSQAAKCACVYQLEVKATCKNALAGCSYSSRAGCLLVLNEAFAAAVD